MAEDRHHLGLSCVVLIFKFQIDKYIYKYVHIQQNFATGFTHLQFTGVFF